MDSLALFSASNRKNQSYNYEKIAKNIIVINSMLNLHLSESECKGIQSKVSQFCESKTKGDSFESRVKKSIRLKMQKAQIKIEECKDTPTKNKFLSELKKVEELIF